VAVVTATASGARVTRGSLGAAVARRSPMVIAAHDVEVASARARVWAAGAAPGATVDDVRVGSTLYRPDGGCTLRYSVRLVPGGREQVLLVHVPAAGTGIEVRPFPADPGLPTLDRAVDPAVMRPVLGRVLPGTGGDRGIGRCAVDVVHHPRQGPCVLRYRLTPGPGGPGELRHPVSFGKVYGDDGAPAAAAAALRVLRAGLPLLPEHLRVTVPTPLAVVPSLRLGLVEAIPGRALLPDLVKAACDPGAPAADRRPLSTAVRAAARLAAAVHACPPAAPLPVRDLAGERTATERELALLEPVWPDVAARLRSSLARALAPTAGQEHRAAPAAQRVAPVLAHGDLTPGQVLLDEAGGVGLVDVDTLCLADPALDLGRFLAYLHVTGVRRSGAAWPVLAEQSALFLEAYLEASTGATAPTTDALRLLRARTAAHRALALARLGARACWQLKDDRLRAAVEALDAEDEWRAGGTG
jgi:aminoglycoside phosphotransferase (APT) family kinase protein